MSKIEDMFDKLGKEQLEKEKQIREEVDVVEEIEEVITKAEEVVETEAEVIEEEEEEIVVEDEIILGDEDEVVEDEVESKTEISEEAFLEYASKKLGRDVKSLSDLETKQEVDELNETVKKINDFVKTTGRSVDDWYTINSFNTEQMSDEQLVKANLALKYPDLNETQINRRFDKLYKLDADQYDEDMVEDSKIDLAIAATEAKNVIGKLVEDYSTPLKQETKADNSEKAKEIKERFISQMQEEVDKIEMFSFDVDGTKVKYKPTKEDIQKIKSVNSNLEGFWERFVKEDGSVDFNALSRAVYFSDENNISRLIKAVRSRYVNEGKDSEIKKRKNTKLPGNDKMEGGVRTDQETIKDRLADTLLREMGAKPKNRIKKF